MLSNPHQNHPVHDDVIKWKHFPRNWPFVREIHRSPVNFPHKGEWRGALMFSLIYAWINDWVNNREAGDLRRQHGHYDVIVMCKLSFINEPYLSPSCWIPCDSLFFFKNVWKPVSFLTKKCIHRHGSILHRITNTFVQKVWLTAVWLFLCVSYFAFRCRLKNSLQRARVFYCNITRLGDHLNIKISSYRYRDSRLTTALPLSTPGKTVFLLSFTVMC